jgi:hypothetical protein
MAQMVLKAQTQRSPDLQELLEHLAEKVTLARTEQTATMVHQDQKVTLENPHTKRL